MVSDRWIAVNCHKNSSLSTYAGGALTIMKYWMYHFNWGNDMAQGKVRIPLNINY